MFSFIPERETKLLKKEYRLRLLSMLLILIISALVLWIIALIPTYALLTIEKSVIENKLEKLNNNVSIDDQEKLEEKINLAQAIVKIFKKDSIDVTKYIRVITEEQVEGISINSISFSDKEKSIKVQGISSNRELLQQYGDSLKNREEFVSVNIPFSNFTGNADIPFNLELKI